MSDVSAADPDQLIAGMLAKFGTPPAPPNLAPFQKAKLQIGQQQAALTPPQAPQLQPIPQDVPKAQFTSAFSDAGLPMMLLAGLAGALTGQPLTSAFNNAASFMHGLQKGDTIANKQALDEFNTHLDAAKSANQNAIDQYHTAFENYNGNVEKLKSELSSIADAEGDTTLKYQIEQNQFEDAYKIVEARQRLNEQLQQHQDMIDLRVQGAWKDTTLHLSDGSYVSGQKNSITGGYRDTEGNPIDASKVKDTLAGVPVEAIVDPDAAQQAAEMAVDKGDFKDALAASGGFGTVGNLNRGIVRNAITKYAKSKGMSGSDVAGMIAQFDEQVAAARTIGHVAGSTAQGAQELQQIAPRVKEVSDRISRTQFPTINAIELAAERGTGNADVIQLNGYIQTLRNAYAQVMTRGGRMSDQTRTYAKEMIDGSLATNQIDAALQAIMNEAAIAQSSAARATQEVTGQKVTAPMAPAPASSGASGVGVKVPWQTSQ